MSIFLYRINSVAVYRIDREKIKVDVCVGNFTFVY